MIHIYDHARLEQRNPTISLSQLQANMGPSGVSSQREIQKVESGYFGTTSEEANFKQLDFDQMDQEEQLLEDQYIVTKVLCKKSAGDGAESWLYILDLWALTDLRDRCKAERPRRQRRRRH